MFEQDGYVHYNGHYGSNNGFDNVFVKGPLDNPTEVIINEARQWPPTLAGPNNQTGLPAQMTDEWVRYVIGELRRPGPSALANAIETALNNGKLTKVVTAVKKTGPEAGQIVTVRACSKIS